MKIRVFSLCIALSATAVAAGDGPPVDVKTMLDTLHTLKEKQEVSAKAQLARVVGDFYHAASSNAAAIDFYEEAIRATQFQGQSRENAQFRDWKKKEADKLKSPEMQIAARLHLNYLALTLQRAAGSKIEDLMPQLIGYTSQILEPGPMLDQPLMKQKITDSLFVKWYAIGGQLAGLEKWEMSPGNADGVFEKSILPYLREKKDPRLLSYWDEKIQREAALATSSRLAFNAESFNQVRRPALLWSRAQDMIVLGQRNRALAEMFALVKNNPGHPDVGTWIDQLQHLLAETPAPPAISG